MPRGRPCPAERPGRGGGIEGREGGSQRAWLGEQGTAARRRWPPAKHAETRRDQDALQIHARVQTGRTSGSPRLEVLCKRVTKQMKIGIPGVSGKDGSPVSRRSVFPSERAWTCSPLRDLCLTDVTVRNN